MKFPKMSNLISLFDFAELDSDVFELPHEPCNTSSPAKQIVIKAADNIKDKNFLILTSCYCFFNLSNFLIEFIEVWVFSLSVHETVSDVPPDVVNLKYSQLNCLPYSCPILSLSLTVSLDVDTDTMSL